VPTSAASVARAYGVHEVEPELEVAEEGDEVVQALLVTVELRAAIGDLFLQGAVPNITSLRSLRPIVTVTSLSSASPRGG
jgi:hypothetical protein